ncbi:MAG: hypothetical protein ACKOFI_11720, partial [Phycisphaerales bacterium]
MQRFLNVFRARVPARAAVAGVLAPALAALSIGAPQGAPPAADTDAARQPSLEETRLTLAKWIETQQIIAKERNDWQQGKEILQGRIDLAAIHGQTVFHQPPASWQLINAHPVA